MTQLDLIGNGEFLSEAEDALSEVTRAVMGIGGKGTVTLTIAVSPSRKYGQLELSTKVDKKLPKLPAGKTILFADDSGTLMADDPRQGNLFEPKKVTGTMSETESAAIRKLAADIYVKEPAFKEA